MDNPERLFEVHAKDPAMEAIIQKIIDFNCDKDEFRDMCGFPRKGREPDYIYGRWCIKFHNSLPQEWRDPCDVCGADAVFRGNLSGLAGEWPDASIPLYGSIKRANDET